MQICFIKDGTALTLPVTPARYAWGVGRNMETIHISQLGDVYRPGGRSRFSGEALEEIIWSLCAGKGIPAASLPTTVPPAAAKVFCREDQSVHHFSGESQETNMEKNPSPTIPAFAFIQIILPCILLSLKNVRSMRILISKIKNPPEIQSFRWIFGTPGWIRTSGLQSRSLSLYPTELRAHLYKTWIAHTSLSSIARFSPAVNPFFKNFFNPRLLKNLTSFRFCVKLHLRIF